jgi:flavin-dependent dehydrogenase
MEDEESATITSRDGRRLRAPFLVAADGVHSVLAKRLGVNAHWPRTNVAIDMMEETPVRTLRAVRPDVLWVAYGHGSLDGYAYVFPKTRHTNVGIGCVLAHFDEHVTRRPYDLQSAFVTTLIDRGVLEGRSDRASFTPYLIPVGGPLPRASTRRVLFAGDAGGFVHALTAEGIYYAMVTGELAGQAIAAVRTGRPGRLAAIYNRTWRAEVGAELSDAVRLQRYLFSNHDRLARVIRGATRSPALTRLLLDYVEGRRPYRDLRRRVAWRFPMAIVRLARQRAGAARQEAS